MRKIATAIISTFAAVPLILGAAGFASAAPGDISAEFGSTTNGDGTNTVTATFSALNPADDLGYCIFIDFAGQAAGKTELYATGVRESGSGPQTMTLTDPSVPDGTYTADWVCSRVDHSQIDQTIGAGGVTPAPILVLPAPVVEPGLPPVCTGSACLPTGSFGF